MSNQHRVATTLTGDGQDGFPSESQFMEQMEDYLNGLNPKKRAKALSMYTLSGYRLTTS